MRMRVLLCWVVLGGCGFHPGAAPGDAAVPLADGPIADVRRIDGCVSFSQQLDTCTAPQGGDLALAGANTFDTDAGTLTGPTGPISVTTLQVMFANDVEADVLFVGTLSLAVDANLRATGTRPFAIVATGAVTFGTGAIIDVSVGGAGARTACDPPSAGQNDNGGAGGGGGGGFGAAGGAGGQGNSDGGPSAGGAAGAAVARPMGPIGGCPGAHGGTGADPGGAGGLAGGAFDLVSAGAITIANMAGINAGGGGGGGGTQTGSDFGDAGGGGGGAGGLVWLEAPHVHSTGILAANGGGGGEASGNGDAGNPGSPGPFSLARANGGAGNSSSGTDGGKGGAGSNPPGSAPGNPQQGGGGGGGGGVGFVIVVSPDQNLGNMVSPAPQ
jgi:hypothetical protein